MSLCVLRPFTKHSFPPTPGLGTAAPAPGSTENGLPADPFNAQEARRLEVPRAFPRGWGAALCHPSYAHDPHPLAHVQCWNFCHMQKFPVIPCESLQVQARRALWAPGNRPKPSVMGSGWQEETGKQAPANLRVWESRVLGRGGTGDSALPPCCQGEVGLLT